MTRNRPLSYPARTPQKRHFNPLKLISGAPSRRFFFDIVFGHRLMREHFKKVSRHGTIPILLGAAVAATGHSQMFVRSLAVILCAIWFSLDVGVWVSATEWKRQYKAMVLCIASSLLCCLSMAVMYWFLLSTLEDQQTDVAAHLSVQPFMPKSGDVFKMGVTVMNGSATDINDHQVICWVMRLNMLPRGGIRHIGLTTMPVEITNLKAYGDAETSYCLSMMPLQGTPSCADVVVEVEYSLSTQPTIRTSRSIRFVAKGEDFSWHPQALNNLKGDYCPSPSE